MHLYVNIIVVPFLTSHKISIDCHCASKCTYRLDIAPIRETLPQKRSGVAHVLKGCRSFTCTPTRSSAIGMSHTCLCLPSYSWYSFTDPGGVEG